MLVAAGAAIAELAELAAVRVGLASVFGADGPTTVGDDVDDVPVDGVVVVVVEPWPLTFGVVVVVLLVPGLCVTGVAPPPTDVVLEPAC